MTDAEAEALGRRLVACKGFRVMRGMLDMQGRTWGRDLLWRWRNDLDVPDLRDPATLGCVLALVREAWGQKAVTSFWGYYWEVDYAHTIIDECMDHEQLGVGGTEAEALVAALEAAP